MYKISVPVNCQNLDRMGRENILDCLKKLDAERVFIATGPYYTDEKKRKETMADLRRHTEFFKSKGFEVGVWNWTTLVEGENNFTYMTTLEGNVQTSFCCFADENFVKFASDYIKEFAECGVDMILFDDDYRYGFQGGMNCTCPLHMAQYEKICGEKISCEEFRKKAFSGKGNKYRDAFLDVNGDAMRNFARQMRKAADSVNPAVRIGLCSCISVWDTDGADSEELARLLAGENTTPFLRLIGAPYWGAAKAWGNRLSNVCEYIRMEKAWCGDGMEIVSEGDTYPRPRHYTPSSFLEIYDTATRASGGFDGILKYGIDYVAETDIEEGYIKAHLRNKELYGLISEAFDGKECVGIRVYEEKSKLRNMDLYADISSCDKIQQFFFSPAIKTMSDNSIPTIYEGEGTCGIAFGENAKYVPEEALAKGLVTDIMGAKILQEQGIDTGLCNIGKKVTVFREHLKTVDKYARASFSAYLAEISEKAEIDSEFFTNDGSGEFSGTEIGENTICSPLSYFYTNNDGQKFYVLCFDAYYNDETARRSYLRQIQLMDAFEKMSGEKMCVKAKGNPDLYIIAKKDEKEMSVYLANIFADGIYDGEIQLDKAYNDVKFINCQGTLDKDKITIKQLSPYSIAAFIVK